MSSGSTYRFQFSIEISYLKHPSGYWSNLQIHKLTFCRWRISGHVHPCDWPVQNTKRLTQTLLAIPNVLHCFSPLCFSGNYSVIFCLNYCHIWKSLSYVVNYLLMQRHPKTLSRRSIKVVWTWAYTHWHAMYPQGMVQNDFRGLMFQNPDPGGPELTGDFVLRNFFDVDVSRTKWENSVIIFGMAFAYRLVFYVLIRASETRLIPIARAFVSRKSSTLPLSFQRKPKQAEAIVEWINSSSNSSSKVIRVGWLFLNKSVFACPQKYCRGSVSPAK